MYEWTYGKEYNLFLTVSSVQSLNCGRLFVNQWTAAKQASFSLPTPRANSNLISIESVMPSNHLILSCPLLFLPSIFCSIRVFSNESSLRIRWPKYQGFSISPSNEYSGLKFFRIDWSPCCPRTVKSLLQQHSVKASILGDQPSLWSNSHIGTWLLGKP